MSLVGWFKQRRVLRPLWCAARAGNIQAAKICLVLDCGPGGDPNAFGKKVIDAIKSDIAERASQRRRLDDRRQGETLKLVYERSKGQEIHFDATFNPGIDGRVAEVFCLAFKEGAELRHLLHHACIIASVGLQHGATMADFAHAMGEDNLAKPPGSFMGVIVRAGAAVDAENGFHRSKQGGTE